MLKASTFLTQVNNTNLDDIESRLLFEDNHLLAINKKPSEIVQGDKTGDACMVDMLKEFLRTKYNKPGDAYLGTIHRLDRPVSGIVLFAKTSKALSRMNELFRDRKVEKTYWAVVKNKPIENKAVLVHYLSKNEEKNKSRAYNSSRPGTLECRLEFEWLASIDNYHLLEVKPQTGRHHQIRVQLSTIGCPIKGDLKYGFNRSNPDASIHLHARQLDFIHPVKDTPLSLIAPVPSETVWQALEQAFNRTNLDT
jgi:23S rRNA pseudouridine1911/1915/1917 synthase